MHHKHFLLINKKRKKNDKVELAQYLEDMGLKVRHTTKLTYYHL